MGIISSTFAATAQESQKHEIRAGISDGIGLVTGIGFIDAAGESIRLQTSGSKMTNIRSTSFNMYEVGYRYRLSDQIKIGADIGYLNAEKVFKSTTGANKTQEVRKANYLVFLPTAEFSYIKTPLLNFYGSGAAGAIFGRVQEVKNLTTGKTTGKNSVSFAYQVNPVGLRVGKRLGAFAELGFGYKGLATLGANFKF